MSERARARKFYETVFGVKLSPLVVESLEMYTFPMEAAASGCSGALVKMDGVAPGGSTILYFSCRDCAEEQAKVVPAGGKVCREKFSIGEHGFVALVEDTEGNMIGLHSSV